MAVSKAVVPLLRGKAAVSIQETLKTATIRPYSEQERDATSKAIKTALKKRKNDKVVRRTYQ